MEKSTAGTNKRSPDGLSLPNYNTILINIKWYYFTRYGKKYNEIQLTKKIDFNIRKMTNHPPSPDIIIKTLVAYLDVILLFVSQTSTLGSLNSLYLKIFGFIQ